MNRYCLGWCAEAKSCDEACDGARWGCEAVPDLSRSTCEKTAAACARHCASKAE